MARQMVGDGDDVYRLKVTYHKPNWQGQTEESFGPFNSIGAARGQRTTYLKKHWVASAVIQVAHTEWSDVQ
ncbi:hypothetical protein [Streptomyces sp. Isolate_219]|uniref:hypothetical protein n=1 Tax=Streptomyces sp. Isolate_219 TaxID=2950110 RepID=UPI0021C7ED9F|nr:hypothetical protein [Streptomyces sp. Isolate_219]MCR8576439.1 hypothetical protein [Streptomyces sp. Isolate_219]